MYMLAMCLVYSEVELSEPYHAIAANVQAAGLDLVRQSLQGC